MDTFLSGILRLLGLPFGLSVSRPPGNPQRLRLQHLSDGKYHVVWICQRKGDEYLVLLLPSGKAISTTNPWYLLLTSCQGVLREVRAGDSIMVSFDPEVQKKMVSLASRRGKSSS
jgi:hypothetical protein